MHTICFSDQLPEYLQENYHPFTHQLRHVYKIIKRLSVTFFYGLYRHEHIFHVCLLGVMTKINIKMKTITLFERPINLNKKCSHFSSSMLETVNRFLENKSQKEVSMPFQALSLRGDKLFGLKG